MIPKRSIVLEDFGSYETQAEAQEAKKRPPKKYEEYKSFLKECKDDRDGRYYIVMEIGTFVNYIIFKTSHKESQK